MKAKSKNLLVLAATFVILFSFSSCKKYEDGPWISFRSKTARLTGVWKVVDGYDYEIDVINTFKKNGDFKVETSYGTFDYEAEGEWSWDDNKEAIIINLDNSSDEKVWRILRLTNKELWFEDENDREYKCEKLYKR